MNGRNKMLNKSRSVLKLILIMILISFSGNLYSAPMYDAWGISKESVIKQFVKSNETIDEFTLNKKPDYDNKIMNMVKLIMKNIDSDVEKEIIIINTKSVPRRDFLLFKNKLFSIMELYESLSKDDLSGVVKKLTAQYGEPNYNPGEGMEIYFISNKTTKIIVHYYIKTKKCEIYYYDAALYRKLSTNEY